jgi:DNA-binding NtrC family response regulator
VKSVLDGSCGPGKLHRRCGTFMESTMSPIKLLCVENDPDYMDVLKHMLEEAGYEVITAASGEKALDLLAKQRIDGVLLEYDLPDAAGTAVRISMKQVKPEVPVLLFSGIGSQTPFLLRFFDAYLRNLEKPETVSERLAS